MAPPLRTPQQRDQRFARVRRITQAVLLLSAGGSGLIIALTASATSHTTVDVPTTVHTSTTPTTATPATTSTTSSTTSTTSSGSSSGSTSTSSTTTTTYQAPVATTTTTTCYSTASGHQTCY